MTTRHLLPRFGSSTGFSTKRSVSTRPRQTRNCATDHFIGPNAQPSQSGKKRRSRCDKQEPNGGEPDRRHHNIEQYDAEPGHGARYVLTPTRIVADQDRPSRASLKVRSAKKAQATGALPPAREDTRDRT